MADKTPALLWFRQDLRVSDHQALLASRATGRPVIPLFIWTVNGHDPWSPGPASRWWLHHSLQALAEDLLAMGSRLLLFQGQPLKILKTLSAHTGSKTLLFTYRYHPLDQQADERLVTSLRASGWHCQGFHDVLFHPPKSLRTAQGTPFKVFTPFWRKALALGPLPQPSPKPRILTAPRRWPSGLKLDQLRLLTPSRGPGLQPYWMPGSHGARKQLNRFLRQGLCLYAKDHDFPSTLATSRLSPHLHFGEISMRSLWHEVANQEKPQTSVNVGDSINAFLRQLYWRDFAYHLLHAFPHTSDQALNPRFRAFPWKNNNRFLQAWQQGQTGYPLVDAGMSELLATGFMHNRVRLVVASFLTKDLMQPWQAGARWFWQHLVDADLPNNTLGWQWTAGCGADAAPFFRIFNPVTQSQKFDPHGTYIRRWLPELERLPLPWLHHPWRAPASVLHRAGVVLGKHYPRPVVDHQQARQEALAAYKGM